MILGDDMFGQLLFIIEKQKEYYFNQETLLEPPRINKLRGYISFYISFGGGFHLHGFWNGADCGFR